MVWTRLINALTGGAVPAPFSLASCWANPVRVRNRIGVANVSHSIHFLHPEFAIGPGEIEFAGNRQTTAANLAHQSLAIRQHTFDFGSADLYGTRIGLRPCHLVILQNQFVSILAIDFSQQHLRNIEGHGPFGAYDQQNVGLFITAGRGFVLNPVLDQCFDTGLERVVVGRESGEILTAERDLLCSECQSVGPTLNQDRSPPRPGPTIVCDDRQLWLLVDHLFFELDRLNLKLLQQLLSPLLFFGQLLLAFRFLLKLLFECETLLFQLGLLALQLILLCLLTGENLLPVANRVLLSVPLLLQLPQLLIPLLLQSSTGRFSFGEFSGISLTGQLSWRRSRRWFGCQQRH